VGLVVVEPVREEGGEVGSGQAAEGGRSLLLAAGFHCFVKFLFLGGEGRVFETKVLDEAGVVVPVQQEGEVAGVQFADAPEVGIQQVELLHALEQFLVPENGSTQPIEGGRVVLDACFEASPGRHADQPAGPFVDAAHQTVVDGEAEGVSCRVLQQDVIGVFREQGHLHAAFAQVLAGAVGFAEEAPFFSASPASRKQAARFSISLMISGSVCALPVFSCIKISWFSICIKFNGL